MYELHGKYVNEADFKNGKEGYQKFIENYISLLYEPLVEDYDETRYFTREFDSNLVKKLKYRYKKKIINIELKKWLCLS